MRKTLLIALLFPVLSWGQIFNISSNGSTDTSSLCAGVLRDPGGNGNYSNYSQGYFVIDPAGSSPVSVVFSSFATAHYYDQVILYDGVGTSGTVIGSYYGSTLPNSGNAISSTSGAMTVRFYSNSYSTSSGFQLSWSTSSSSNLAAAFTVNSTSVSYNTPVVFVNTSTGGGTSYWDFGDGTTSTDHNPTHSFTQSGNHTVTLVVSDCNGSDTTTSTISVGQAPAGSLSNDTIQLSIPCGTTATQSWTVSNGSGGGNLVLSSNLVDTNFVYTADFEDGSTEGFTSAYNNITNSSSYSNGGSKALRIYGYNSSSSPVQVSFPTAQPAELGYASYKVNSTYNSAYTYFMDPASVYISSSAFGFSYWYYGSFRVYYKNSAGYNTYYTHSPSSGSFVELQYTNIDWTAKTYDIVLDGSTVVTGATFYNSFATGVSGVATYNNYSYDEVYLDDVYVKGGNTANVTYTPTTSSTIAPGNNVVFNFTVNASGMYTGTYYLTLELTSNDTLLDGVEVPVIIDITGGGIFGKPSGCHALPQAYTGKTVHDTVAIWNVGCDTLRFSSTQTATSSLQTSWSNFQLAPDDSAYIPVTYLSSTAGSIQDTLYLLEQDSTYAVCFAGSVQNAATITTADSLALTYNGCTDSVQVNTWIHSSGSDSLHWSSTPGMQSIQDDFNSSTINTSIWNTWGSGAYISSSCGTINGTNTLTFYSSSRYIDSKPLNLNNGGTVSFSLNQGTCDNAESGEGVSLYYSLDGIYWVYVQYFYTSYGTTLNAVATLPTAAHSSATRIRLIQNSYSGSSFDNWIIDDFEISGTIGSPVSIQPNQGSIAVGDSQLVSIWLPTDSITSGIYDYTAVITSNDPIDSLKQIHVTLTLNGESQTLVHNMACINVDTIVKGATYQDSIWVENTGCADFTYGTFTYSASTWSATTDTSTVAPYDSSQVFTSFTPTSTGAFQDTVYVVTTDTTWPVCYTGYVQEPPVAVIDTSGLTASLTSCNDSVAVSFTIENTGLGNLDWNITADDGIIDIVLFSRDAAYTQRANLLANLQNSSLNYNLVEVTTATQLSTELSSADLLIMPAMNYPSGGYTYYTNLASDVQDFVDNGGGLICMANGYMSAFLNLGILTGSYYTTYNTTYTPNSSYSSHPIVNGVSAFYSTYYSRSLTFSNAGKRSLIPYPNTSGADIMCEVDYGQGLALYFGFDMYYNTVPEVIELFENAVEHISGSSQAFWVNATPNSGTVQPGDSTTVQLMLSSTGLTNGTHTTDVMVATNDPNNPTVTIPVTFTVNGVGETGIQSSCVEMDTLYQGMTKIDSVQIWNQGCDTLVLDSLHSVNNYFTGVNLPLSIAPWDTLSVPVSFLSTSVGAVVDTLVFYSDVDTVQVCANAHLLGAPNVETNPAALNVKLNKCNGFTTETIKLKNTGQGTMNYDLEVADFYVGTSTQYYTGTNQTQHTFSGTPTSTDTLFYTLVINGDFSYYYDYVYMYIDGYYLGTLYDNNVTNGTNDTVHGYYTNAWTLGNILSDSSMTVTLYNSSGVLNTVGTQLHQISFEMKQATPWVSLASTASGTLNAGSQSNVNLLLNAANLSTGTYQSDLMVRSNDPGTQSYLMPISFEVVEEPEILLNTNIVDFGLVTGTATVKDSVMVINNGCGDLDITSIQSSNTDFTAAVSSLTVTSKDTSWLVFEFTPTVGGQASAVYSLVNNDSLQLVNATANVVFAPVADFQFTVLNGCSGLVAFSDESSNAGQHTWLFGDGNQSALASPQHTYTRPGTYTVTQIITNAAGADTITKTVSVNDVLYAEAVFPDTVQALTTVQFIDSSQVPNSWTWYFGDGNTSSTPNPQHVYNNKGTFIVTMIVGNAAGCSQTVNNPIVVLSGIGIEEFSPERVHVYPNPSSGIFRVESAIEINAFTLYDAYGKVLDSGLWQSNTVELSDHSAGTYYLMLQSSTGASVVVKLVKT